MKTFSEEFKKKFLLEFTRELIRHSPKKEIIMKEEIKDDFLRLREFVESKEPIKLEIIPSKPIKNVEEIRRIEKPIPSIQIKPIEKIVKKKPELKVKAPVKTAPRRVVQQESRPHLFIPELKLPPHLEYLKPIPTPGIDIDLFKLNPLINDPAVRLIEVNPEERVMVTGTMGTKPTDIILNKEDIDRVINAFYEKSRIPINEGIYRVVAGNLILSAIISGVIGSKFVIKKMAYPPVQRSMPMQRSL